MPTTSARRAPAAKRVPIAEAKKRVVASIAKGNTREAAMADVGRSVDTYKDWMKNDPAFKAEIQRLRAATADGEEQRPEIPDFPEFCEQYLKQPLPWHLVVLYRAIHNQQRSMDEFWHEAFRWEQGATGFQPRWEGGPAGRMIVNIPPGHGKTTSITVNYSIWQIHRNPNIRIAIICKDQQLGKDIVTEIKFKLTSPVYAEMHARFAPTGGWKDPEAEWAADRIRVAGITAGHKDPTIQAIGFTGRIYGARLDMCFLDDAVTGDNVREYERQRNKISREILSRLDGRGLLVIIGTRIETTDLYSFMRDNEKDFDGTPLYTYFSMPCLLEDGQSWDEWRPLWPEQIGFDGRPVGFTPRMLATFRANQKDWALIYQQEDVPESATFNAQAVDASINGARFPGPLRKEAMGHPTSGMDGLYVIGGLDPAAAGFTAMIVMAINKHTGKRYVLDGVNEGNLHAEKLIAHVQRLTEMYHLNEWVIETNAVQRFIVQVPEMERWLRARGVKITRNYTTQKKFDPDFGIQAMAQLFLTCGEPPSNNTGGAWKKTPETALIELPATKQSAWARELVKQLVLWQPSGMKVNQKTDLVMALWFCNIAANRILDKKTVPSHLWNPFLTKAQRGNQQVVDLQLLRELKQLEELEGQEAM